MISILHNITIMFRTRCSIRNISLAVIIIMHMMSSIAIGQDLPLFNLLNRINRIIRHLNNRLLVLPSSGIGIGVIPHHGVVGCGHGNGRGANGAVQRLTTAFEVFSIG